MISLVLAIVALIFAWLYFREHRIGAQVYNNEQERKMLTKKYMDLHNEHWVLHGQLKKAEDISGKYLMILKVLKSRFPHAWEIVINELYPLKSEGVRERGSEEEVVK